MDEPLICPLCLYFEPEIFGDFFVVAKCGHMFHNECISKIVERKIYQCPLSCAFPIEPDSLQRVYGVSPESRRTSYADLTEFTTPKGIPDVEYSFKVAVLGDPGVGKTCFIRRFADNTYSEGLSVTVGVDLVRKVINIGGTLSQLIVWDCAGQHTYRSIIPACVRGVHGLIFVYDITNMDTFESISNWVDFSSSHVPPNCVKILIGNKCDQKHKRKVDYRCGKVTSEALKMPFFETSARDAINVESVFRTVTAKLLQEAWTVLPSDNAWQHNSICLQDYSPDLNDSTFKFRKPSTNVSPRGQHLRSISKCHEGSSCEIS